MKSGVKNKLNKIKNIILTVVLVLLVLAVALIMIIRISGNTPSIGGYSLFRVATGSMEPEISVGDVILVKAIDDYSSITTDDVVTYYGETGSVAGKLITHKVIVEPYEKNGQWYLQTQGIANVLPDPVINADQLVGVVVATIPFLRVLYDFFLSPWGLITVIVLIILAFSGEFINIVKILGEKPEDEKSAVDIAVERIMAEKQQKSEADAKSGNGENADNAENAETAKASEAIKTIETTEITENVGTIEIAETDVITEATETSDEDNE